ncbi:MAG: TRAP transporter large permease subunit [Woeseiaceae bacterium]|nr:TRAP transporter large permease subunit [Woeseiaceae bacterium]
MSTQTITPDAHGIAVVALIVTALILFTRDRLPLESSSLAVIVLLLVGFHFFTYDVDGVPVDPAQFLLGFGNEALVAICSLIVIGKALETTGALQPVAVFAAWLWSKRPKAALLLMLVAVFVMSAFVNDTPIVVLMIPILVGIALRAKLSVSGFMLPMGLATIIGGMTTTIGTSTNLLVVGITRDLGIADIAMFDITLPAVIVGAVGLLYIWLVVPRLLPDRAMPMIDTQPRLFDAQLTIREDGFAVGKTLKEVLDKTQREMRVDQIRRGETLLLAKMPSVVLQAGDRLCVKDTPKNLKHFETEIGATLFDSADEPGSELPKESEQQLAEIVITAGSPLHRRRMSDDALGSSLGLILLAVHRARLPRQRTAPVPGSVRLRAGDVVLVQGTHKALDALKSDRKMLVVDGTTDLPRRHRAKRALFVLALVIGTAATGLLPISVSAFIGVGLMIVSGCLDWRDVGRSLPVAIILLIVASLAMGKALIVTGMAEYLAAGFVNAAQGLPIPAILSAFILIMAVLTNIVSNNAAAVIGTPIAIAAAQQLQVDPLPFVLAVLFGANMSFATPFGYQTNLLILSTGGYRFADFLKAGVPLILILWAGFSIVLPVVYGL